MNQRTRSPACGGVGNTQKQNICGAGIGEDQQVAILSCCTVDLETGVGGMYNRPERVGTYNTHARDRQSMSRYTEFTRRKGKRLLTYCFIDTYVPIAVVKSGGNK